MKLFNGKEKLKEKETLYFSARHSSIKLTIGLVYNLV